MESTVRPSRYLIKSAGNAITIGDRAHLQALLKSLSKSWRESVGGSGVDACCFAAKPRGKKCRKNAERGKYGTSTGVKKGTSGPFFKSTRCLGGGSGLGRRCGLGRPFGRRALGRSSFGSGRFGGCGRGFLGRGGLGG